MKVIVAGMGKTGAKSVVAALRELGYNVHDFMEQFVYHFNDYQRIMTFGGTTEDFRRMYENVDAVADHPAAVFWDEIHAAFPEAKIILTMRDDEEAWWKSFVGQVRAHETTPIKMMMLLSPTLWKMGLWRRLLYTSSFAWKPRLFEFGPSHLNEMLIRMSYRRHNAHVLQNAPKDKLLDYSVEEGWEPLCKFLDKPVPSKPFPHKNVGGSLVQELFKENSVFIRIKRESTVIGSVLFLLLIYGGYRVNVDSFPIAWIKRCINSTKCFFPSVVRFYCSC